MASLEFGEVHYNTAHSDREDDKPKPKPKPKPVCKFCNTHLYKTKKANYPELGYCAKCSSSQNAAGQAFYTIEQKKGVGGDKKDDGVKQFEVKVCVGDDAGAKQMIVWCWFLHFVPHYE